MTPDYQNNTTPLFLKEIKIQSDNPLYIKDSLSIGVNCFHEPMLKITSVNKEQKTLNAYAILNKLEFISFLEGKQTYYQTILKSKTIFTNEPKSRKISNFHFIQENGPNIFLNLGKELTKYVYELEPLLK